jgi:hypothetical protein
MRQQAACNGIARGPTVTEAALVSFDGWFGLPGQLGLA